MRETTEQPEASLLVAQRYFEPRDSEQEVSEFIINRGYAVETIFTNVSSKTMEVAALVQIPQGSLPLRRSQFQESKPLSLYPYETERIQQNFYFPAAG